LAELGSTLLVMARERLTLEHLLSRGRFDAGNHRHRRALDESGPLEDPKLEAARENAVELRRMGARVRAAEKLRLFAELVERPEGVLSGR
jgi:hypothetical protein